MSTEKVNSQHCQGHCGTLGVLQPLDLQSTCGLLVLPLEDLHRLKCLNGAQAFQYWFCWVEIAVVRTATRGIAFVVVSVRACVRTCRCAHMHVMCVCLCSIQEILCASLCTMCIALCIYVYACTYKICCMSYKYLH